MIVIIGSGVGLYIKKILENKKVLIFDTTDVSATATTASVNVSSIDRNKTLRK